MSSEVKPEATKPDHNALGKASFIIGIIGLVLSFVPFIGFVSWLLAPLAILFGLIALMRPSKSLAIAGIITGAIALFICFSWIQGTKAVGEAFNKDTFNTSGKTTDLSEAPPKEASIKQLWQELEDNKIAAGEKYGKNRLSFTDEVIADFSGDSSSPVIRFEGKREDYLIRFVGASFDSKDGPKIATFAKKDKISFVCENINETFGEGYSLGNCKLK